MFASPFDRVTHAVRGAVRAHRASRTMAALASLDDRTLRDIGIARAEIPGVALEIASGPRGAVRLRS